MSKLKAALIVSIVVNIALAAVALADSIPLQLTPTVHVCLTEAQATSFEAMMVACSCPEIESQAGMDEAECTAEHIEGSWVRKVPAEECTYGYRASTTADLTGTWDYTSP